MMTPWLSKSAVQRPAWTALLDSHKSLCGKPFPACRSPVQGWRAPRQRAVSMVPPHSRTPDGTMVAPWWHHGGTVVAPWWHRRHCGGTIVAPSWHPDWGLRPAEALDTLYVPLREGVRPGRPRDPVDVGAVGRPRRHRGADVAQCRAPAAVERLRQHRLGQVDL